MTEMLFDAVRRYADAHASGNGMAFTPIPGLTAIRSPEPSGLLHTMSHPLVCLVLQGAKQVTTGSHTVSFGAGESLLITADVPIVSQIVEAPYYSLALDLSASVIADLTERTDALPALDAAPLQADPTEREVADAALRLMRLLERPAAIPVLHAQLVRELHYWLLMGKHGAAIRRLGSAGSHVSRIARAVAMLRAGFAKPLTVDQLASEAGMSPSSFHQHFRAMTSLSPLQFQKQLRLIEARRLMTAEGANAGSAAFAVGYESVPQFTREYRRLFGLPPGQDTRTRRGAVQAA